MGFGRSTVGQPWEGGAKPVILYGDVHGSESGRIVVSPGSAPSVTLDAFEWHFGRQAGPHGVISYHWHGPCGGGRGASGPSGLRLAIASLRPPCFCFDLTFTASCSNVFLEARFVVRDPVLVAVMGRKQLWGQYSVPPDLLAQIPQKVDQSVMFELHSRMPLFFCHPDRITDFRYVRCLRRVNDKTLFNALSVDDVDKTILANRQQKSCGQ
mmetsp:Transcript_51164/g.136312  ORF Transcript_51164/g.136312 Transcript_51164/m.136312 type:complete len:211 (-) Transcript_51164:169-801(-)